MTTSGEPIDEPRNRRSRAVALLGLLAVAAAVTTWVEVHYASGPSAVNGVSGGGVSQDSLTGPALGDGGNGPNGPAILPEPTTVLPAAVDIPSSATNANDFQEARYALGSGTACKDVFATAVPATTTGSCQGYVTASYVSTDHSVLTSVTVLGFKDAASADHAAPLLGDTGVAFRQPGNELPGVTAPPTPGQSKVEQVGRFVTVVQSSYATEAVNPSGDLETPTWFLTAQAADAVMWNG
jgi:hypothetical protein